MGISAARVYCKAKWGLDAVETGSRQVLRTTGGTPCVCDVNEAAAVGTLSRLHTVS